MKRDIVILLGGGAMTGIFGAGVVNVFEKMNFYKRIEAIYGVSAGVPNGAYFLTKQTKFGSSVYYKYFINNFIFPKNFLKNLWNKIIYGFNKKIVSAIDIDYAMDVIENKKKLNIERLKKSKIRLYAKLLNIGNGRIEYVDVRRNPIKIIKAAISVVPYYSSSQKIWGRRYIDGAMAEPIGLRKLMKRYPKHKFIIVINYWKFRAYWHSLKISLESFLVKRIYKKPLFKLFISGDKDLWEDINLALNPLNNKRVLLIHPPKHNPTYQWTTDYNKLMETYNMGLKEAKKVKKFLDI